MNAFREYLISLIKREDIRISTVCIEYFNPKFGEADPIIFKFGHESRIGPIKEEIHGRDNKVNA
jgi:hypothetical protein